MATTPANAQLPDTPAGHLAGELIRHANNDGPVRITQWVPSILSASIASDDKASFIADLASAARDSGGLDVFDVRTDPHQPGLFEVAVKGRRNAQSALFLLAADPAHPDQLTDAHLVSMDNPFYADWPKGPVSHAELGKLIRAVLDKLVRVSDFSGCVAVSDGGETVFDECRGLAERSFNVPVDHQTKFHIGSIGKIFTAVAIAQLVEAGKLSWNDTLAKWVPEYPDQATAKKITVWELLHHTAGLGDFMVPDYFEHAARFVKPVDYLALIARQPKLSEPGKGLNYSNASYILLGRIVENVSGESYFDYIQHHVFEPAQMASSGFDSEDEIVRGLAVGYYHDDGMFSRTWKANWVQSVYKGNPAGGGYSTNADLLRFVKVLHGGKLLKSATLAKMFDDTVPAGPGAIGAGIDERLSHGLHIRGHQGGIEGTTADLEMVWETGAAVALTSNEGPSQHWLLAEQIADLLAAEGAKN
ncbi:CubicO group peptidase (beta-lactamase class C family) [Rhodanobacter sp. K2T2]|uniref:serine hydrolase domain-containing protein n=1 Tax=Rhodanobacter sp. K2T2 TaxID=2723085 RepID=UPI0015CB5059|nr:serine hydrolase domain-containing protein [Rhodanobacter sp. K2T2]NYE31165.1 CubicO group peptidase (beta-lactamase class C family) [Rhodanobacter sp. K2T2]